MPVGINKKHQQQQRVGGNNSSNAVGRTWGDVGGLNINIDNLSLSGKPKGIAPSMNQMAGSGGLLSPTQQQPPQMLFPSAGPASMPFMPTSAPNPMVAQQQQQMMNPARMTSPANPFMSNTGGFSSHTMASPNGTTSPFHSAFGK